MILYYSATGNSEFCARRLAERCGDKAMCGIVFFISYSVSIRIVDTERGASANPELSENSRENIFDKAADSLVWYSEAFRKFKAIFSGSAIFRFCILYDILPATIAIFFPSGDANAEAKTFSRSFAPSNDMRFQPGRMKKL